jgi:HlyD family secretion protein
LERITGAAMDQPLPRQRRNTWALVAGGLGLVGVVTALSQLAPRGLAVAHEEIRIATVERGLFRNDIVVRATAAPLHTVMLDALESGRVEEVLANDGAAVTRGQLLFRLSNPQLRLDLVAREADRAQQISNLSLLRVAIETSRTEHQRRMLDLRFAHAQAEKTHARFAALARDGVIATRTLEESADELDRLRQSLADEQSRAAVEMRIKRDGARQMEQAIERLDAGLKVVNESIDGLAVRAPISGRLTDFRLQLGEIVKPEQRIGRIDDPSRFKLVAVVDEYFLGRVVPGKAGIVIAAGRDHEASVSRVFPQIKDGRFTIELEFAGDSPPGMNPGQGVETRITLGETSPALILPNDAWLNDNAGNAVFVLARDARHAERRAIRIGRRNNAQVEIATGLAPGERVIVSGYSAFGAAERLAIN